MADKQSIQLKENKIRIGISSCLLGKKVRFDATHKQDKYITDLLGQFIKFVPVCPEIEIGMGVPRESVRLIGNFENPKMVGSRSGEDWTERMNIFASRRIRKKDLKAVSGFILKKKSPSCGMERVKVYIKSGAVEHKGIGLFAAALMKRYPELPVEEEGRLNDSAIRENFIERVFAYNRMQMLYAGPFSRKSMVEFHTAHKFMLMSHSPDYYRQLGKFVARIKEFKPITFKEEYRAMFMRALKYQATVRKHTSVLEHITGFLKNHLSDSEKKAIHESIADYHNLLIPLIIPITLLRHFISKYEIEYIKNQYYLDPHPKELMLRNHV